MSWALERWGSKAIVVNQDNGHHITKDPVPMAKANKSLARAVKKTEKAKKPEPVIHKNKPIVHSAYDPAFMEEMSKHFVLTPEQKNKQEIEAWLAAKRATPAKEAVMFNMDLLRKITKMAGGPNAALQTQVEQVDEVIAKAKKLFDSGQYDGPEYKSQLLGILGIDEIDANTNIKLELKSFIDSYVREGNYYGYDYNFWDLEKVINFVKKINGAAKKMLKSNSGRCMITENIRPPYGGRIDIGQIDSFVNTYIADVSYTEDSEILEEYRFRDQYDMEGDEEYYDLKDEYEEDAPYEYQIEIEFKPTTKRKADR